MRDESGANDPTGRSGTQPPAVVEADDFAVAQARREQARAEAETVEELHELAAKADAARRLLKRIKASVRKQNEMALYRLKCLRKLGAFLASARSTARAAIASSPSCVGRTRSARRNSACSQR